MAIQTPRRVQKSGTSDSCGDIFAPQAITEWPQESVDASPEPLPGSTSNSPVLETSILATLRSRGAESVSRPVVQFSRQRSVLHERWISAQLNFARASSSDSLPSSRAATPAATPPPMTPQTSRGRAQRASSPDSEGGQAVPALQHARSTPPPMLEREDGLLVDGLPISEDGTPKRRSLGGLSDDGASPYIAPSKGISSWLLRCCSYQNGPFTFCGNGGSEDVTAKQLEPVLRRRRRAYSAPGRLMTEAFLGEGAAAERPTRLIELFYVVGQKTRSADASLGCSEGSQAEAEPSVVLRLPATNDRGGQESASGHKDMGDARIASFCLPVGSDHSSRDHSSAGLGFDWQAGACPLTPGVPFAFTVLAAAVLPPGGTEQNYPDPTDLLYCTAVCFDEALHISCGDIQDELLDEEVSPHAYCIVSRHPFVAEFGELLLRLHSGEDLNADVGSNCSGQLPAIKAAPTQDGTWSMMALDSSTVKKIFSDLVGFHNEEPPQPSAATRAARASWQQTQARLRKAAAALRAAVPGLSGEQAICRSHTVPPKSPGAEGAGTAAAANEASGRAGDWSSGDAARAPPPFLGENGAAGEEKEAESTPSLQLGAFEYPSPSQLSCPPWASLKMRQRSDALLDWAAGPLFESLEIDVLLQVLTALLLEFRVLVVTSSVARGSAVVLGLTALLWPFSWQQLLLPICPPALEETIIDAPVPFLCAVRHVVPRVGRCSALLSDGGASRPRRSRSTFSTGSGMSSTAMKSGVVICQADKGTVSVPPESAHVLRRAQPQTLRRRVTKLKRLREQLLCRLGGPKCREADFAELDSETEPSAAKSAAPASPSKVREGVAALCVEFHAGMVELARSVLEANKDVRSELGSQGWLRQMQTRLVEASRSLADPAFQREFANTETCLMFLAEASK